MISNKKTIFHQGKLKTWIKRSAYLFTGILVLSIPTILSSCAAMGTAPSESDLVRFESSQQFVKEKGLFDNVVPHLQDTINERLSIPKFMWDDIWVKYNSPDEKLPEIVPNYKEFLAPSEEVKSIWFGHSTFLLNIDGQIILVDPVFGDHASPVWFMINRYQAPVSRLEELPEIDVIVISHDHYDHLDMETVEFFVEKETKFVVPLGVGSHLKGWGISEDKITERDWWESTTIDSVEYIATPAQHFSGRGTSQNNTLWASWVIRTLEHKIYFSGDTGYSDHFKQIGEKYGPFDVAYLECGQYNETWKEIHMLPDDIVKAYQDLGADFAVPVHWAMFDLSMNPWFDPIEEIYQRQEQGLIKVATPQIGEMFSIHSQKVDSLGPVSDSLLERDSQPNYPTHTWWKPLMKAQVQD